MILPESELWNDEVWRPALEKYAGVTHLTVSVFNDAGQVVCGPIHRTPFFDLFARHGYDPGIFAQCARLCLAQGEQRPPVLLAPAYSLAVVGTSLVFGGRDRGRGGGGVCAAGLLTAIGDRAAGAGGGRPVQKALGGRADASTDP